MCDRTISKAPRQANASHSAASARNRITRLKHLGSKVRRFLVSHQNSRQQFWASATRLTPARRSGWSSRIDRPTSSLKQMTAIRTTTAGDDRTGSPKADLREPIGRCRRLGPGANFSRRGQ
jgi:hypothetical protein